MMHAERSNQSFDSKLRTDSFTYDVKRDVYNEETFQQQHRTKTISSRNLDIDITTFRHHVECRCSSPKFLRCMLTLFPFLEWVCFYRFKDWLLGDLLAGLNVGLVQVPQVLTFGLLARQLIPPLSVSYAAFSSSIIYVIFGSCHQMSIGNFFLVSALMINVLNVYPFNNGHLLLGTFIKGDFSNPAYIMAYNKSLSVVASTTFLTGIIQLCMSALGFGFVATYLPEAVISAYLAAAALHVILSQLAFIFGITISFHAGPASFFYSLVNYCMTLPKANSTSILLFLTTVVALRINKCIRISFNQYPLEFPMEIVLILGFTALANKVGMATENTELVMDMIPYSFLFPIKPDFSIFRQIILEAISLALVSSSLLIFVGKKIASFHNYNVNSNQDLIAMGLCNVVSSFFNSCVFTGAMIRTIIQDKSGGRQQFASLVGAGVMLLLMVKVKHFFYEMPNAVLAGIILSNLLPYFETIYYLPSLWKQSQYDCVIWAVTFLASLLLGLDLGLLISIMFAFFIVTVQSHKTKIFLLGQIPNTNIYRNISDYREIEMKRVPLKEEEIFRLFNPGHHFQRDHIWRCYCNCDELEPLPRIVYTERFESKLGHDTSSINLIRCSRLESINMSESSSERQIPFTVSSMSRRIPEQNYEDVEDLWFPNNVSGKSSIPLSAPNESLIRDTALAPYSSITVQSATHTIILDFTMVHYVDSRASVILRQMCNAFQNANILVLIAGCHSSLVRSFERNDFFDAGITKAQMFLSVHDAVLFALSRKFADYSELSLDESETVIQETYSEKDQVEDLRHHMDNSPLEMSSNINPDFTLMDSVTQQKSDLDMELDTRLESEQDSEIDQFNEMDPESESKPEHEPESEIRPRSYTYPQKQHRSQFQSMPSRSPTYPRTWSVDKRRQKVNSYPPMRNDSEDFLDVI
ncbi:testis anion transporter 1 isoform X2 [Talpa occidentalis]|uniref:testis anion transporter 1 isoform X2 n=1 Tax=Talpa occidentalis TaxID=50954 RepID=UPI00188E62DA|nr:testis anion transporter 1 isoform X2 [Talpa occidentalis]